MMKELISLVVICVAAVISFLSKSADSTGTRTYLSDDGFPIMFLENIVNSVSLLANNHNGDTAFH